MRTLKIVGILLTFVTTQVWSERSPMFYGWFFNEAIANELKAITGDYLTNLYENVEDVQEFLKKVSRTAAIENPLQYYTKPVDPNTGNYDKFFHITSFYCGTADCSNYSRKVEQYLNQMFITNLVGVYFTPRTYGVRVNLTSIQREIFDINESNGVRSKMFIRNDKPCDPPLPNKIDFCPQDDTNFQPTDTRAHITLGCAPNISAVTTGLDLLEILDLEMDPSKFCAQIQTDEGNLIRMGERCDIFVVYLQFKMIANSTFEVYYNNGEMLAASVSLRVEFLSILLLLFVAGKWFSP